MDDGYLRSDFGSGNTLVPVAQALGLGCYAVCTWLFAVAFDLMDVSAGCSRWTDTETGTIAGPVQGVGEVSKGTFRV
jgi:hypothetical protein